MMSMVKVFPEPAKLDVLPLVTVTSSEVNPVRFSKDEIATVIGFNLVTAVALVVIVRAGDSWSAGGVVKLVCPTMVSLPASS